MINFALLTLDSIGILFCGLYAGDNFCSQSLSSVFLYESWLYLVILSPLTADSIGFFSAAYMPVIISVYEVCHLAFIIRFYLIILSLLTSDSIGIFSLAYMPVIISVH